MNANDAVLVGIGMMTPVGLSAPEAAASVRSATMRFTESAIHDKRFEPFTLAAIPDAALPPLVEPLVKEPGLTSRVMRMLRLAQVPLAEAMASLPPRAPRPGLLLALPETETTIPLDGSAFLRSLTEQCGGAFDPKYSLADHRGRSGGLSALGQAVELVRSGQAPVMLAGGVDSYRDLYVLGTLDMEQRVKSSSNLDGFIPGEGAVFLLVASGEACGRFGMQPLALLSAVKEGVESGHLYSSAPYRGDGLAATIRQVWESGALTVPAAEVWSTMNGENHWGKEWGVSFLRNRPMFTEDVVIQHPADCYGDLGAASAPALVALAALGIRGGYRRTPAVVYASSDHGGRAATVVQGVGHEGT